MTVPDSEDPFATHLWVPRARPASLTQPVPVRRADAATHPGAPAPVAAGARRSGHTVLGTASDGALRVRFQHYAPQADAVALQANGWWHPLPARACDLRPQADGWFTGVFEVPPDWCPTCRFVEHHGPEDPPWWTEGLKRVPPQHLSEPWVIDLSGPQPWAAQPRRPASLHELAASPHAPRARVAVLRGADTPPPAPSAPLPLLIVFDGEAHAGPQDTPAELQRAVTAGLLPEMALVLVDAGPRRAEVLGVPDGRARWVARELAPRLREEGLDCGDGHRQQVGRIVVTGSSFGGLSALFALAQAPTLITDAVAQSPSLWRYGALALRDPLVHAARDHGVRIRVHAGRYEGDMVARAERLVDAVRAAAPNAAMTMRAVSGGHDWAWWQPELIRELGTLLAPGPLS